MVNRRTRLLEEMFVSFATKNEKQMVETLYSKGRKGAVTVYMLRRVHKKFFELMGSHRENVLGITADREIVINDWRTRLEVDN